MLSGFEHIDNVGIVGLLMFREVVPGQTQGCVKVSVQVPRTLGSGLISTSCTKLDVQSSECSFWFKTYG